MATFTCEKCRKELSTKYMHKNNICVDCVTAPASNNIPRKQDKNEACTHDSTELYLKLSNSCLKTTVALVDCMILEFRKLDKALLSPDINLINSDMVFLVLDKNDGTPYVIEKRDDTSNLCVAFKVSYNEIKELMSENKRLKYADISNDNWYEYTILQEGETLPIYYEKNGDGPYHEEARFGIRINKNGYTIICEIISPMGGSYRNASELPFGSFKDKSISDVEMLLKKHVMYIDSEKVKINNGDYLYLTRTDEYRTK